MRETILHIKNMVCPRCLSSVQNILDEIGLSYAQVSLGEVVLHDEILTEQKQELSIKLKAVGFELLDSKESMIINQIKSFIIEKIHYEQHQNNFNMSDELSKLIGKDYSSLSKLFSRVEGVTIEHYVVSQRIEKVKELLTYNQLSLNEIAFELNYSSAAYLSAQFKKMTGMTPTEFKKLEQKPRNTLDSL